MFFAKNVFFQKKHDFSSCALNLDARRIFWSVPDEAELAVSRVGFAFLQTFLKKWRGLVARRDFRLATGNTLT